MEKSKVNFLSGFCLGCLISVVTFCVSQFFGLSVVEKIFLLGAVIFFGLGEMYLSFSGKRKTSPSAQFLSGFLAATVGFWIVLSVLYAFARRSGFIGTSIDPKTYYDKVEIQPRNE